MYNIVTDAGAGHDEDLTLGHHAEAGGDGLVGGDAGHGHRVGGDPVREARAQGSLAGDVGGLHFLRLLMITGVYFLDLNVIIFSLLMLYLDDSSSANVIHDILVNARLVDEAGEGVSLEIVGHQVLVIGS